MRPVFGCRPKNTKPNKEKKQFRVYKGNRELYLSNVELIAHEIQGIITETNEKTLIVCYKSIVDKYRNKFNFEIDLNKVLKSLELDSKRYTVRHFGAATTGVNDFREYKNIVFIGLLNKGNLYYTNKTLSIGSSNSKVTELSEHIIDCIQQIGRICVRQGEEANVYMLFQDTFGLTEEFNKHFLLKKKEWIPKYFNGINNATLAKQNGCWFAIINELKKLNEGDEVSLKSLQDVLKSRFKIDTVYRYIEHPQIENFIAANSITYNRIKRTFKKNLPKITKQ